VHGLTDLSRKPLDDQEFGGGREGTKMDVCRRDIKCTICGQDENFEGIDDPRFQEMRSM
jgi:hypothetical protein